MLNSPFPHILSLL